MPVVLTVAIVLLVLWVLGRTLRFTTSGLIHIALVLALILLIRLAVEGGPEGHMMGVWT